MTSEEINESIATKMGWKRLLYEGGVRAYWFDGKIDHPIDAFTTASAEWCEFVLKPVLDARWSLGIIRLARDRQIYQLEEMWGARDCVSDPDLYTAVALAFLAMGEP